jgi:hypothetical protein
VARGQSYFVNKLVHTRMEVPVDSNIRSHGAYSIPNWGLSAEPFAKHQPYDWPGTGASLILISLLSLGLWAAIWGTVASLTAVLG